MLYDEVSTVGTANFDNRALRLDLEVTAMVAGREFASGMQAMFEAGFAHAQRIDPADFDRRPFCWRLGVGLSRLVSPVRRPPRRLDGPGCSRSPRSVWSPRRFSPA